MSNPIQLPLNGDDRLAEPPLLDLLNNDAAVASYAITFIPPDDLSHAPTENVSVDKKQPEGQRITALLARIGDLCNGPLEMIAHLGGGNYTIHLRNGTNITLDDLEGSKSVEVFDRLKQIAVAAELAFLIGRYREVA
jgi:hypothetical protein